MASPDAEKPAEELGPTQMMMTTPAPVLHLLARTSPLLSTLTGIVKVLIWESTLTPFTLIILWWAVCLFGIELARYGLNAMLLLVLGVGWIRSRGTSKNPVAPEKMDPSRFAKTLDNVRSLDDALAKLATFTQPVQDLITWQDPHASLSAISYLLTSYPFVLALTMYVPLPHLFGSIGTLVICWNAPWFALIRRSLARSLVMRWVGRLLLGILGGGRGIRREVKRGRRGFALLRSTLTASSAPPSFIPQRSGGRASMATAEEHHEGLHYTFTIYENQRWWVGLDWTQALLPNERPSWSDAHHAPVAPPQSFLLPAITVHQDAIKGDDRHKLKRTTEWRWLDDWSVRKATTAIDVSSIGANTPASPRKSFSEWTSRLSSPNRRGSDSGLVSGASVKDGKGHARALSNPEAIAEEEAEATTSATAGDVGEDTQDAWDCDEHGWQYGDNSWLPLSSKGKLGRYTRRRAWQRTAIVAEKEEKVPANSAELAKSTEGEALRQRRPSDKTED